MMKMFKLFILEDDPVASYIVGYLSFLCDIDHARNLYEAIEYLEVQKNEYDAIILDVAMEGIDIDLPELGIKRKYDDKYNMNGYLYFKDKKDEIFGRYKGRLTFFTGYKSLVATRAEQEGITDFKEYKAFDKSERDALEKIKDWINDIAVSRTIMY